VIGEDLPKEHRIRYLLFPEGEFSEEFLGQVTDLLLRAEATTKWRDHNRDVIRLRFSEAALRASFQHLLDRSFANGQL
jgi:hypothetical protein